MGLTIGFRLATPKPTFFITLDLETPLSPKAEAQAQQNVARTNVVETFMVKSLLNNLIYYWHLAPAKRWSPHGQQIAQSITEAHRMVKLMVKIRKIEDRGLSVRR